MGKETLSAPALAAFISDLLTLTSFAKKKGVSKEAVYQAVKTNRIQSSDIIRIDTIEFIRWSQYKDFTFRKYPSR